MRLNKIIAVVLLGVLSSMLFASSFGQPGAFLRFGANARALAMGGAHSTVANNADALLYNPAGLANLERWELTLTHAQLFLDSRYEFVSFAYPVDKIGNFGLAIADMGISKFDGRDEFNRVTGEFGAHDLAVMAGYGRWVWGRKLRVGGSAKFWMASMDDNSASGFGGVDIGVITKNIMRRFRIGAAMQNLGSGEIAGDKLPMTIRGGVWYNVIKPLYIVADVEMAGSALKPMIGAEYKLGKIVKLRAGYNFSEVTFGMGVSLDRLVRSFQGFGRPQLDYGGAVMNQAGNDFARFSLTFCGAERYKLSDLLAQTDPCLRLTEFEGMLDKDGIIGARANLMFGDCYFMHEYFNAPLDDDPNFNDIYPYFREAYYGKFGSNWTQQIMALEGANLIFSQRTHHMYLETAMHKEGTTEEIKRLAADLIFVGGDSIQYDTRLEYDMGYIYENLGYLDSAKNIYNGIAVQEELEDPVRPIAVYRLAYLLRESDPDSAINLLDGIVRNFGWGFYDDENNMLSYPMFPKYKDNGIADDALLLMGGIYRAKGNPEDLKNALQAYLDIALFYPMTQKHVMFIALDNAAKIYETMGMNEEAESMRARAAKI